MQISNFRKGKGKEKRIVLGCPKMKYKNKGKYRRETRLRSKLIHGVLESVRVGQPLHH